MVIGVQVGDVDGLQVSEDFERPLMTELAVNLKKCALSAVEQNKIV